MKIAARRSWLYSSVFILCSNMLAFMTVRMVVRLMFMAALSSGESYSEQSLYTFEP